MRPPKNKSNSSLKKFVLKSIWVKFICLEKYLKGLKNLCLQLICLKFLFLLKYSCLKWRFPQKATSIWVLRKFCRFSKKFLPLKADNLSQATHGGFADTTEETSWNRIQEIERNSEYMRENIYKPWRWACFQRCCPQWLKTTAFRVSTVKESGKKKMKKIANRVRLFSFRLRFQQWKFLKFYI